MLKAIISAAIAGAAGATALNAATYADMAWRGRPSSSAPERTVETIADRTGHSVRGPGERRNNRLTGLGALTGIRQAWAWASARLPGCSERLASGYLSGWEPWRWGQRRWRRRRLHGGTGCE